MKLTPKPSADLSDVTLADEEYNSIPTDDANRAIIGNTHTIYIYTWTYMDRRVVHITFNYYNCSFSPL